MTDMPVVVQHAPQFSTADAVVLARGLFGIEGAATPLASERDQNFLIADLAGARFVLKIANATENRDILDFQNRAIEHLAAHSRGLALPRIAEVQTGDDVSSVETADRRTHFIRMLTWVQGAEFADVRPHSEALLRSLGRRVGEMDRAFAGFSHPAMHRPLRWDLRHIGWIRDELPRVVDLDKRAAVERCLDRFDANVAPRFGDLRMSVIHNDWNDRNVLVSVPATANREVVGAVDFGDMVFSPTIGDLAVAASYAMLDKPDPIAAAAAVVSGYHESLPPTETELALLYDLICARLCLSVAMAACQGALAPGNAYLQISQRQVWSLLRQLQATPPAWAHYAFRHACGLPPCPETPVLVSWLERHVGTFTRVVDQDLRTGPVLVVDLGAGSLAIGNVGDIADVNRFTRLVFDQMERNGVAVGIGRYDEARLAYTGDRFLQKSNDGDESRTVHLGIDLFVEPETQVYAPLEGTIHSFRNNHGALDYGPTIIIEHRDPHFYTLYGHLSAESITGLEPGARVGRGEAIGTVGSAPVNGGWPPHLHFQIIADILGREGEFPGVAPPSQREIWLSLSPNPNLVLGIPDQAVRAERTELEDLVRRRRARLGRNLSISYREPLAIVRGHMQYLFDADGRRFLDAVNNVPHVGHSHPRVVRAVADQMAVLNTNTRYLHRNLVTYAERLCALLPNPLRVCYIVCSGSEANELALRLARAHTQHTDFIVVEGAYHGNTSSLIDISPYKFDGPGGSGCPAHVRKVPMPDVYRGSHRGDRRNAGALHAQEVAVAAADTAAAGRTVAAFVCESLLSCGGQIVLPAGYLASAYRVVRAAGGVCIADEVQVGFGRVGTHVWGFATQGVVPDIVTMGKPIGNGFPLAAVVTTEEIAASFDTGMEYFNTYGGNPVSCAAGLAVLDVLDDERLQERALTVGAHLKTGLKSLMPRFPLIGDVRGLGLFLGIELVRDPATLEPAARQASYIVNRIRNRGILVSTDGPLHNVIKIKPPLPFGTEDADRLIDTLEVVLAEDPAQP